MTNRLDSWTLIERQLNAIQREQDASRKAELVFGIQEESGPTIVPALTTVGTKNLQIPIGAPVEAASSSVFAQVYALVQTFRPSRAYDSPAFFLAELGEAIHDRFSKEGVRVSVHSIPVPKTEWRHASGFVDADVETIPVLEIRKNGVSLRLRVHNGKIQTV